MTLSRRLAALCTALCLFASHSFAMAQAVGEEESLGRVQAEPPDRIDLTVTVPKVEPDAAFERECEEEQEAAEINREIVVCGDPPDQSQYYTTSRDGAQDRYARETTDGSEFGLPEGMPGEMIGPGIFKGAPTAGGMCFIGPCPDPPAYIIDFDELPEPPEGSDADLIAKGKKRAD